jgi:hypothetical protein
VACGSAIAAALIGWLLIPAPARDPKPPRKPVAFTPAPREIAPTEQAHVAAAPEPAVEVASDGIPIKAAGAEDSTEHEPKHPHPVDETRRRIYRENNLNGALMGAMNVGDYQGLRALIQEYEIDYPEDTYRLQEGYTIIADCMEELTTERQERAREYWKTKRGSLVRRFIRRLCLEKPTVD